MNKRVKKGCAVFLLAVIISFCAPASQADEITDFVTVAGRVTTIVPAFLLRVGAFFVEGVLDGAIEGVTGHKGYLHGESKFI